MSRGLSDIVCVSAISRANTYYIIREDDTEVEIELRPYHYKSSHTLYDNEREFVEKYILVKIESKL
jgi:hypothetical protein